MSQVQMLVIRVPGGIKKVRQFCREQNIPFRVYSCSLVRRRIPRKKRSKEKFSQPQPATPIA